MLWQWRKMQNLKKNWLVQNRYEEFNTPHWPTPSKISKICTLMGCFWPKYKMFQIKKYRGVMFDDTQYWQKKFGRKLTCCFKNHKNLMNSDPSTQKSQRFTLWLVLSGNIWPKKVFYLKLFVMTMGKDVKLEEELTWHLKIDMRNSRTFDPSTQKSQKFTL